MQTLRAARTAAVRLGLSLLAMGFAAGIAPAKADWKKPWESENRALVIDAYEFNPIDWKTLTADKRIAGFINKASDGLPPDWNCRGKNGDEELLCKNRWWKYSVTKELYMTRRVMAKELGLKWGAYHLGRPGNPREQADHFIDFAEPAPDELIALDIEDNTAEWMSLADAEIFANQIFIRTGRYPVLYTNGSTAKWISDYRDKYALLSRLPLWYARYRDDITGKFPETTWPSYALWQFSSMHNCSAKKCPYRVKGAKSDIDVNVSPMDVAGLRAAWPFNDLVRPTDDEPQSLVADLGQKAGTMLASFADSVVKLATPSVRHVGQAIASGIDAPKPPVAAAAKPAAKVPVMNDAALPTLVSAYGPATARKTMIDPLALLTETALWEKAERAKADVAPPAAAPSNAAKAAKRVDPDDGKIASLNAFEGIESAMDGVAAIAAPTPRAKFVAQTVAALGVAEKSRLRGWLDAAVARDRQTGPAAPAAVFAQNSSSTAAGCKDRVILGHGGRALSPVALVENRVRGAFLATR